MKKILILIVALTFVLCSFSACKKEGNADNNTKETTTEKTTLSNLVTVETTQAQSIDSASAYEYATQGYLLPIENIKLGDSISKVYLAEEAISEKTDDENPSVLFVSGRYYYKSEDADSDASVEKEIYKIISYNSAYNYICGENTMEQIKQSMGDATEVLIDNAQVDFLNDKISQTYMLSYTAGTNLLEFYFQNDFLVAVALSYAQ